MARAATRPEQQAVNKPKTNHGKMNLFSGGGEMKKAGKGSFPAFLKKGAAMKDTDKDGMKCGGGVKKMAKGGGVGSADGVAKKGRTSYKVV